MSEKFISEIKGFGLLEIFIGVSGGILRGLSNGILQNPIKTSTIGTDIVHVGLHEKSEIKGEKR